MARRQSVRYVPDGAQGDLLGPLYLPRGPSREVQGVDLAVRIKRGISQALKESGKTRSEVAAEVGDYLGRDDFSKASLDKYSAESAETHMPPLLVFVALVRVTGALWLLDLLAKEADGRLLTARVEDAAQLQTIRHAEAQIAEAQATLAGVRASLGLDHAGEAQP